MKRMTKTDLQGLYGPVPDQFADTMDAFFSGLPEEEEKMAVRKKVSVAAAAVAILILITAGAAAALVDWNVVIGLYGRDRPEMESMVSPVNRSAEAMGTTLSISGVLTDGKALVFDWTLETEEEALPLFVSATELIVNGHTYLASPGDGLQWLWLSPGETIRQGTEIVEMEQMLQPGEKIRVELSVKVSRPKEPVTFFDSFQDREKAAQLRKEGTWAVAPIGEWISRRFDEENKKPYRVPFWQHYKRDGFTDADFEHGQMQLLFDLTVPETEKMPVYPACEVIELRGCTAYLKEAYRTKLGVYTRVEVVFHETADEEGTVLELVKKYQTSLELKAGNATFPVQNSSVQGEAWIGEDGRVHQVLEVNMIGYQDALLQEGGKVVILVERLVEYPLESPASPAYYYTTDGRFPIYFTAQ